MLCFVISKRDWDLINDGLKVESKYVCIGGIEDTDDAQMIANTLPCVTEVHIVGDTNKVCYITCNY